MMATNSQQPDFANFDPKIGCHGNVPWTIGKGGQIGNLRYVIYGKHLVKMGPVGEFSLIEGLLIINTEKEINASRTCMPHGLNKCWLIDWLNKSRSRTLHMVSRYDGEANQAHHTKWKNKEKITTIVREGSPWDRGIGPVSKYTSRLLTPEPPCGCAWPCGRRTAWTHGTVVLPERRTAETLTFDC